MAGRNEIACLTVEYLRFGGEEASLTEDSHYIRAAGYDETVVDIKSGLSHRDFLINMGRLRYRRETTPEQITAAQELLASHAVRFLPDASLSPRKGLTQIDVVTKAAELWAFPFEAWFARHIEQLARADQGVIITRRIRGDFSSDTPPWPDKPHVLFVHAPSASDLEPTLIDLHMEALCKALEPWAAGGDPVKKGLLTVFESSSSVQEFRDSVQRARYDFIHILAHGAPVPGEVQEDRIWGLRLGSPAAAAVHPKDIADALRPVAGHPLVVTLAACDSGNQDAPAMGNYSVAQELHRCGVPVVVGSQLPLTKPGSAEFARSFYGPLLEGLDVRAALHAGRVAVRKSKQAGHDWMSVVAYVRLPSEGYAEYLDAFGLRAELGMLKALQTEADDLTINGGTEEDFGKLEKLLSRRIDSLEARFAKLRTDQKHELREECGGLLASAHKRHAELLFTRAGCFATRREPDLEDSREALKRSLATYRAAFRAYPQSHWNGMQQLALELALNGVVETPSDWDLVCTFAEHVRDHDDKNYWASGTLIEAFFIGPLVGKPSDLAAIRTEIATLRQRSGGDRFAIESTRRQIKRYEAWWTNQNGFFPGVSDLSADAKEILDLLTAIIPASAQ